MLEIDGSVVVKVMKNIIDGNDGNITDRERVKLAEKIIERGKEQGIVVPDSM